ncbi:hypothetical protein D9V28_14945 [Mycetocola zhadangensis]|uniref:Uncharacterized protein n=1 Tax=Mycetocola zhadangensis TaxID=1164595 RepID=A0A3L7IS45_9MICO|nr:hypothetical protein D9V28_14945 [Mycetocola zhadangensis]
MQQSRPIDKSILRQLIFGAVLVVGFEFLTGVLSLVSNAIYGMLGNQVIYFIVSVVAAAVFAGLVVVSALYIVPIEKARNTVELLKKLVVGGAIGLVGLVLINLIWAVIDGGSLLGQVIFSSAFIGSILTALTLTAIFVLGVLIARNVPPRPRAAAPQFGAPQGYPAQQQTQAPQGYAAPQQTQAPQGYAAPQGQVPQQHAPQPHAQQQQQQQQHQPQPQPQQQAPQYPAAPQAQPPYPPQP